MKWLERMCGLLVAFAMELWLIFLVLYEGVLNTGFLMWRYKTAYDTAAGLRMTEEDLRDAVVHVIRLMKGKSSDYEFTAVVKGETVTFLNPKEIDHMQELTGLLGNARGLILTATLATVAAVAFLWCRQHYGKPNRRENTVKTKKKTTKKVRFAKVEEQRGIPRLVELRLAEGFLASMVCLVIAGVSAGVSALIDLREFVVWLHSVFFRGESWVLNSATDRLMHLCPLGLFRDGMVLLGGAFGVFVLIGIVCSVLIIKQWQKEEKRSQI